MTPHDTTITTQAELAEVWSTLMQPLGFGGSSIWLMLIGPDDRPVPRLLEIEDTARPATPEEVSGLAAFLTHLGAELPGARFAGVSVEVVHRACDVDLVPVPMDEVLAASARALPSPRPHPAIR